MNQRICIFCKKCMSTSFQTHIEEPNVDEYNWLCVYKFVIYSNNIPDKGSRRTENHPGISRFWWRKSISKNRNRGHCVYFLSSLNFAPFFHTIAIYSLTYSACFWISLTAYNGIDGPSNLTNNNNIEKPNEKFEYSRLWWLLPILSNGRKVIPIYRCIDI